MERRGCGSERVVREERRREFQTKRYKTAFLYNEKILITPLCGRN